VELAARELRAPEDVADLGAVAVADGDIPALAYEGCDVIGGCTGGEVLIFDRGVLGIENQ
jgi:hypothetical protein